MRLNILSSRILNFLALPLPAITVFYFVPFLLVRLENAALYLTLRKDYISSQIWLTKLSGNEKKRWDKSKCFSSVSKIFILTPAICFSETKITIGLFIPKTFQVTSCINWLQKFGLNYAAGCPRRFYHLYVVRISVLISSYVM